MKKIYPQLIKAFIISFCFIFSMNVIAQEQLSREEISMKKAEDRVENYRLKLVDLKRQIESADSLFVAGEELEEASKLQKMIARDDIKVIEKKYKADKKPIQKRIDSDDRGVSSDARIEMKELTAAYKITLKEAQNRQRAGEKGVTSAGRMMDKGDKKLDLLSDKLKTAENSYVDAEKALNAKKGK